MGIRIRVPEKFSLLGREWRVRQPKTVTVNERRCWGASDARLREVELEQGMDPHLKLEIFAHEFTHAVLSPLEMPPALEERVCRMMEYGMPEFVKAVVQIGRRGK